jgi:hypothetical protein
MIRLKDYATGEVLPGHPSPALKVASYAMSGLRADRIGCVYGTCDVSGVWQYVPASKVPASKVDGAAARLVYVEVT